MNTEKIIRMLNLVPHDAEGGYYRETYRSAEAITGDMLPGRYGGARCMGTAIYYLLTPDSLSVMHKLASDEVFHFYLGDPVEMLQLYPDGAHSIELLGSDLEAGQHPQLVVPTGVWQGCRLVPDGRFALMGTTVAPGFEMADFETGSYDELARLYLDCVDMIRQLTR
ncbi:MAG: cupin domain-containing protein [Armatimonadota bacterium]